MVVGLVLEHEKPFLKTAVHIHVHIDAAGIVLLADFHVVQQAGLAQIASADSRHIHEVQAFMLTTEFLSHLEIKVQCPVNVLLHEGFLDAYFLQLRGEGRVAAMVAPICVQYAEFRLVRIAAFFREVFYHLAKVVRIHGKSHLAAERLQVCVRHFREAIQHRHRFHGSRLGIRKLGKVLLAGLHGIDIIMLDLGDGRVVGIAGKDDQLGALDSHIRLRVNEMHAVHSRSRPLVELPWKVLHGNISGSCQVAFVGNLVRHDLAEDAVTALFEKFRGKTEQIIDIEKSK